MIRQSTKVSLALFAAAAVVSAADAQQPTATAASTKKAADDPNERICRDIASSRLETKRYCATRAEWQAFEQREREEVQLMQRPMQGCVTMGGRKC
jgi:hypothetical protein